jgi:protein AATF/BFR2
LITLNRPDKMVRRNDDDNDLDYASNSDADSVVSSGSRSAAGDAAGSSSKRKAELDDIRAAYGAGSSAANGGEQAGPSRLRKRADKEAADRAIELALNAKGKYQGVKASRDEVFGEDEDESGEDSDEEEGDDEEDEGSNDDDAEDFSEGEDEDSEEASASEDGDEDDDLDQPNASSSKAAVTSKPKKSSGAITLSDQAADEALLLSSLSARKAQDAAKGRATRKQKQAYELALDLRIRAQKVVTGLGSVDVSTATPFRSLHSGWSLNKSLSRVQHAVYEALQQQEKEEGESIESATDLASTLLDLSSQLFHLRCQLLTRNHGAALADSEVLSAQVDRWSSEQQGKKRKVSSLEDASEAAEEHLDSLFTLENSVFWPLTTSVLSKWSSQASIGAASSGGSNKFNSGAQLKAVNQSPVAQIENSIKGDALSRLKERTMTWRGGKRIKLTAPSQSEDDKKVEEVEKAEDIFDDTDFYHALLRELIESKGAATSGGSTGDYGDNSLSAAAAALAASGKKIKKQVDTKASKGRKLRYEVHEKIQNFMPPISTRVAWSSQQMDRLFSQLGGKDAEADQSEDEAEDDGRDGAVAGDEQEQNGGVELNGLRLFG